MGSLHHVNGGSPHVLTCHHCTTTLGDERAVANTPSGPKYFCKMESGSNPFDSCYNQWRRRHN
jgi:hypothetical protein